MPVLPWGSKRSYTGWNSGILEGAEPSAGRDEAGRTAGVVESSLNYVTVPSGRVAVRGGTSLRNTFHDASAVAIARMLTHWPFSPVGALITGWSSGEAKHYAWRLTELMEMFTGVEATSRIDLTAAPSTAWDTDGPARPTLAELFEKMYLCDAQIDYTKRHTLLAIDGAGTVEQPSFDFVGGSEALRPYCLEEFGNVLFIAGYGDSVNPDDSSLVRHSFLGKDPAGVGGFDPLAYETVGAKGQRITGMRKGKNLMLIAKANELYRLSGAGRAREGWQYAVEAVTNSEGHGVVNPLALAFTDPYWFGVGLGGPFRTDGRDVERLDLPRRLSWKSVGNLDSAWVSYHPERNAMIFGMNRIPRPAGYTTEYPYEFWAWSLDRECWMSDWRNSMGIFYARAIHATSSLGPSSTPGDPTVDHSAATNTSIRFTFTPTDADALTEVWARDVDGGSYLKLVTLAAAPLVPLTYDLTGLSISKRYVVKLRHSKGGVRSDFTAEVQAYTRLEAPPKPEAVGIDYGYDPSIHVQITYWSSVPGATVELWRAYAGGDYLVGTSVGFGEAIATDPAATCGEAAQYYAHHIHPDWPMVIQQSVDGNLSDPVIACFN